MKTVDISAELTEELCNNLKLKYHHSNYCVFRESNNIKELFCFSGSDIIDADNVVSFMNNKKDGWNYYFSGEVTTFE